MIPPGEKPILRFKEGEPFPNAKILFEEFKQRDDYKKRYIQTLRGYVFLERKSQINTPNIKTRDALVDKVKEVQRQLDASFKKTDPENTKIKKTELAGQWGIILDTDFIARETFAFYIYHDSE